MNERTCDRCGRKLASELLVVAGNDGSYTVVNLDFCGWWCLAAYARELADVADR